MEISVTLFTFKLMCSALVVALVSALFAEALDPLTKPKLWAQATCIVAGFLACLFFVAWVMLLIWVTL